MDEDDDRNKESSTSSVEAISPIFWSWAEYIDRERRDSEWSNKATFYTNNNVSCRVNLLAYHHQAEIMFIMAKLNEWGRTCPVLMQVWILNLPLYIWDTNAEPIATQRFLVTYQRQAGTLNPYYA